MLKVGNTFTCAVTGEKVVVEQRGCSFNYCYRMEKDGPVYMSLEGSLIEIKEQLKRREAFTGYVSGDTITTWVGQKLATIHRMTASKTGFWRTTLLHVRAQDEFGGWWHGKGAGDGQIINMYPTKGR